MKQISDIMQWNQIRKQISTERSIGFVPTMGCLHKGHASLIQRSLNENNITLLSIFVNPTQFNDPQDYEKYPNTLAADLVLAADLKVDYVLTPDVQAIYPDGDRYSIDTTHPIASLFEGKYRPGHFKGVLTVVMKLLQLVNPNIAYFGEKDYQQYVLIKDMAKNFFLTTDIIACPIIRELSGLPFSSRNTRLSAEEKLLADRASQLIAQTNLENITIIKEKLEQLGIVVDYLENYENRIFSAFRVGSIRIIDNFSLIESPSKTSNTNRNDNTSK